MDVGIEVGLSLCPCLEVSAGSSVGADLVGCDSLTIDRLSDLGVCGCASGDGVQRCLDGSDERLGSADGSEQCEIDLVAVVGRHLVDVVLVCDGIVFLGLQCLETKSVVECIGKLLVGLPVLSDIHLDRLGDVSIGSCGGTDSLELSIGSESVGGELQSDTHSLVSVGPCSDRCERVVTCVHRSCDLTSHDGVEIAVVTVTGESCALLELIVLHPVEVVDQCVGRRSYLRVCGTELLPHFDEFSSHIYTLVLFLRFSSEPYKVYTLPSPFRPLSRGRPHVPA